MGRNLLAVFKVSTIQDAMAEIRRRCNNSGEIDASGIPDFRGIMIGDYIDGINLSGIAAPTSGVAPQAWNNTYKNNRIVVSGFNTYKGAGDTENVKNHVLFTFRNVIAQGRINEANDNTGGYPASEMRSWLEGASGDGSGPFATGLKSVLGGNYLYTIRKAHSIKASQAWNSYTVFLASELEVFGFPTYGDEGVYMAATATAVARAGWITPVQFPIYQKGYDYRIKRFNGSRAWWWTQTPTAYSATAFCCVTGGGNAYDLLASDAAGGVSPAFCVA
jgi:hypothetical protein